jgi:hypothetical protein
LGVSVASLTSSRVAPCGTVTLNPLAPPNSDGTSTGPRKKRPDCPAPSSRGTPPGGGAADEEPPVIVAVIVKSALDPLL